MSTLAPVRTFEARLAAALAEAEREGRVTEAAYDRLLAAPDFDTDALERFRLEAIARGLSFPEEPEPAAAIARHAFSGEPERDLLDLYLREIGRVPLLAHEQLLALAVRSRHGDEAARKKIIVSNLRLVVHLTRAYRNRGLSMLDLIEEGNLGLIQATDRFEPERGLRFSTYASIWIRQAILRGIAEHSRSVRLPVQMFQQVNRYARTEASLRGRLGREPSPREMARELGISAERVKRLGMLLHGLRSLDEGSTLEAFERISTEDLADGPPSVERLVEMQLEHERIDRLLRTLGQREEQIVRLRYGFYDGVSRTLAQAGSLFGITRERVRQIESRALAKLRLHLDQQALEDVMRSASE